MKDKDFDCVQMKNELQEQLYNNINPSTIDEYFEKLEKKKKNLYYIKSLK